MTQTTDSCLFCDSSCTTKTEIRDSGSRKYPYMWVGCPICGDYFLSEILMSEIASRRQTMSPQSKINCAHRCVTLKKEIQGSTEGKVYPFWITLGEKDYLEVSKYSNDRLINIDDIATEYVDHADKPYKLLNILSNQLGQKGAFQFVKPTSENLILTKIPTGELEAILHFLVKKGFISNGKLQQSPQDQFAEIRSSQTFCLTIEGWEMIRERYTGIDSKNVFIAMKFDWPDKQRELAMIDAVQKACAVFGYEAKRVDEFHTGYITDRIISDIKKSRFIVADFTFNNPGVYYEAGYAKALGKNVFHIIDEAHTSNLHFDIKQVNYKTWKEPGDITQKLSDWIGANFDPNKSQV